MKKDVKLKLMHIKVLVLDVDGVMTNGKINIDDNGHEIKVFDVQDGYGIKQFQKFGGKVALLSARRAPAVSARAKDLKLDKVYQDAHPKNGSFQALLKHFHVKASEVCYMGDDLLDIPVLLQAGFAVAVNNAAAEAKKAAHYVTKRNGGDGAVREVIELILKAQAKWQILLDSIYQTPQKKKKK